MFLEQLFDTALLTRPLTMSIGDTYKTSISSRYGSYGMWASGELQGSAGVSERLGLLQGNYSTTQLFNYSTERESMWSRVRPSRWREQNWSCCKGGRGYAPLSTVSITAMLDIRELGYSMRKRAERITVKIFSQGITLGSEYSEWTDHGPRCGY